MRRLILLMTQTFAWLFLSGCILSDPHDDVIKPWTHTNASLGYTITFPAEWGWFENTNLEVYAISPEKDGVSFHVRGARVSGRNQDTSSLMDIVIGTVLKIEQTQGYESAVFPAEQRGSRTVIPTISIFVSGGVSYTRKTLYFEKGDYVGTIDFTGPSSRFSTDAEIQGVEASLTFF